MAFERRVLFSNVTGDAQINNVWKDQMRGNHAVLVLNVLLI